MINQVKTTRREFVQKASGLATAAALATTLTSCKSKDLSIGRKLAEIRAEFPSLSNIAKRKGRLGLLKELEHIDEATYKRRVAELERQKLNATREAHRITIDSEKEILKNEEMVGALAQALDLGLITHNRYDFDKARLEHDYKKLDLEGEFRTFSFADDIDFSDIKATIQSNEVIKEAASDPVLKAHIARAQKYLDSSHCFKFLHNDSLDLKALLATLRDGLESGTITDSRIVDIALQFPDHNNATDAIKAYNIGILSKEDLRTFLSRERSTIKPFHTYQIDENKLVKKELVRKMLQNMKQSNIVSGEAFGHAEAILANLGVRLFSDRSELSSLNETLLEIKLGSDTGKISSEVIDALVKSKNHAVAEVIAKSLNSGLISPEQAKKRAIESREIYDLRNGRHAALEYPEKTFNLLKDIAEDQLTYIDANDMAPKLKIAELRAKLAATKYDHSSSQKYWNYELYGLHKEIGQLKA